MAGGEINIFFFFQIRTQGEIPPCSDRMFATGYTGTNGRLYASRLFPWRTWNTRILSEFWEQHPVWSWHFSCLEDASSIFWKWAAAVHVWLAMACGQSSVSGDEWSQLQGECKLDTDVESFDGSLWIIDRQFGRLMPTESSSERGKAGWKYCWPLTQNNCHFWTLISWMLMLPDASTSLTLSSVLSCHCVALSVVIPMATKQCVSACWLVTKHADSHIHPTQ